MAVAVSVLTVYGFMGVVGKWAMGIVAERITARYALMVNFCGQVAYVCWLRFGRIFRLSCG